VTILLASILGAVSAGPLIRLAYRVSARRAARAERICRFVVLPLLGIATLALFLSRYMPRDIILPMVVVAVYAGAVALFVEIVFEGRHIWHHCMVALIILGILLSEGLLATAPLVWDAGAVSGATGYAVAEDESGDPAGTRAVGAR
jgi:hypothetical protein